MMKSFIQYALTALLTASCMAQADNSKAWQMDGFATIGVQQVNQSNVRFGANTKNEPDWVSGSVLGLQGTYKFTPQWSVTGQFLVRPDESDLTRLAPKVEWLFASYRLNDELMVRAGQLRLPLYMYSEKLYVGKAYPMAMLPVEVYGSIASNTYQGADVLWRKEVGNDAELLIQPYMGRFETSALNSDKRSYVDVELKNLYGVNVQLLMFDERLKLRSGYFSSDLVYPGINDINATLNSFGASYSDKGWLVLGEFVRTKLNFSGLKDVDTWYVLTGKQLGKWFPYISYGAEQRPYGVINFAGYAMPVENDMRRTAIGLTYSVDEKSSIKAEYAHSEFGKGNTGTTIMDYYGGAQPMPIQGKGVDMVKFSYNLLF